jgi:formiminotetrahydrofolate cyclodeaminase
MAAAIGVKMAGATAAGQPLAAAFTPLQEDLLRLTDRDSEAVLGLRTAAGMPAGEDGDADLQARRRLLRQATLRAAEVALAVAVLARKIALLLDSVPPPPSPELASQPAVARHLAQAACLGACACAADRLRGLDAADPDRMRMETELSALQS